MGAAALPRWRVFPALALGTVMAVLDISVVNIALPTLSRAFQVPLTTVEWVVLAYVLAITGLLLNSGARTSSIVTTKAQELVLPEGSRAVQMTV